MAESVKNVYANAMFQLCEEQGCCDEVFEELDSARVIFRDNEELVRLLASPLIENDEKRNVLEKIFGGRVCASTLDFFCVVTEKGRAAFLESICDEFKQLYYKKNNIVEVSVITAKPLSARLRDRLDGKLAATLGKKIIMHESVDASIIGGIIVRYDNSEMDSSVRGQLDKLKAQLDSVTLSGSEAL